MRLIRLMGVALCAVILTAAATTARAADPVKIRIGWIAAPANLAPILFAKPGIAQNLGKTYELEPIRFNGSPAPPVARVNPGRPRIESEMRSRRVWPQAQIRPSPGNRQTWPSAVRSRFL